MSIKPTLIETPDDAIECANIFALHINADTDSAVVQCEFMTPAEFPAKDASDIILAVIDTTDIKQTRKVTTNFSSSGSHPGQGFTISATKL